MPFSSGENGANISSSGYSFRENALFVTYEWIAYIFSKNISNQTRPIFLTMALDLTPVYCDLPTFRVAGLRGWHTFVSAPQTIPPQWAEFNQLALPGKRDAQVFYGVNCQFDMPNQRFEYMCAFEVLDFEEMPAENRMIVPAAHYAVFTHTGGLPTLHDTWQWIMQQWLPNCGHKRSATPEFERYDDQHFDPATGHGNVEIWIPIHR